MVKIELLEFGYSLEYKKHFIKFDIQGIEEDKKEQILPIIANIPLEDIKRFVIESNTENSLKILEYFPEEEYPFNKEIPDEKTIINITEMVKGFLMR